MSSMLTLVLVTAVLGPLSHHFATRRPRFGSRTAVLAPALAAAPRPIALLDAAATILQARRAAYEDRPPARPFRNPFSTGDPLAQYRAVTGVKARVRWWQRLLSLVGLAILVVIMGALVAGAVGLLFFGARIVLELLVG